MFRKLGLVLVAVVTGAGAALGDELIPPLSKMKADHPRVLIRPTDTPLAISLAQLAAIDRDADFKAMLEQLRNQNDAASQAMVWLLTKDDTAAEKAIARMRKYRFPGKVDTFHIFGRLTEFGQAYDWLYNCPQFSQQIKAEVRANVLPLAREGVRQTNDHMFHNYIWMSAGGVALWAMATAGDDEASSAIYDQIRRRFNDGLYPAWQYLDGLPSEPMGYWSLYVFTPGVYTLLAAQSAYEMDLVGKVRQSQNGWLDRNFENLIQSTLPNMRYIPWGDLQSGPNGGVTMEMACVIDAATWALRSPHGRWFGQWLAKKRGLARFYGETAIFYMLYARQLEKASITPSEPLLSFLAGGKQSGHFIARSGWDDGGTVVAFTCTDHFGDHHHYDQGSFIIYRRALLAVDPPVYRQVRGPQQPTEVHNTLLIGGRPQRPVRGQWFVTVEDFKKNLLAGRKLETGDILFSHDGGGWAAVAGQFAQAYDCPELQSCVRQLLFVRPGTVIVVDRLAAKAGEKLPQVQWLLQLPGQPKTEGGAVVFAGDKSWIRCRPMLPGGVSASIEPTAVNTQRVSYAYPGGEEITLVHALDVGDGKTPSSAHDVKVSQRDRNLELTIDGQTYVFASEKDFAVSKRVGTASAMMAAEKPAAPTENVAALVKGIKVLPDKAPDCSSLKSIAESVTRGCKTNDEKAIAIYNFMMLSHYHRQYPSEPGGIPVLKEINTYGWSLCGGLHAEQSALWRELGWGWRFVGWNGHTTVEAKYDDKFHYLDVFLKFYAWMPDANAPGGRTIAGEDDLNRDAQGLILDKLVLDQGRKVVYAKDNQFEMAGKNANWTAPALLTCGDTIADVVGGLKTHHPGGPDPGWAGINHATGNYSADVNLAPGYCLTNTWEPLAADGWYWAGSKIAPQHTCGNKDMRNDPAFGLVLEPYFNRVRSFANGTLVFAPDFSNAACVQSFAATSNVKYDNGALVPAQAGQPASVTVLLQSPYVITKANGAADGGDNLEISIDGGKTFRPADLKDFTAAVKGQVGALARIGFKSSLKSLRLEAMVQNNPGSLPYLSPGKNIVTVSVESAAALGANKLVITYAYCTGYRDKSFEQLCNEGKEIAKQHNAAWSDTPTVVQKMFAASDLPVKFEIDIPTPNGKYPVYPRMLFIRREVIAPGAKPQPLPANAQAPKLGPDDELKTLPNPFLIGSAPPPARIVRPIKTTIIELNGSHFVTRAGDLPGSDFLKWPKNSNEKVEPMAYLIGGELKELPALENLAAARLVFPAIRAHPEVPTRVGVVALRTRFAPRAKFDFANLGDVVGSVIVPKLPNDAPDWSPPKQFKIDVTRAIRAIASGDAKFNGFALRVVPDRGVDDGWTVRINLPRQPRIYLEIESYAEASK